MHERGWGKTTGYPAAMLDEQGEQIDSSLFTARRLVHHWPRLEAFVGEACRREIAQVRTEADEWRTARVFVPDS